MHFLVRLVQTHEDFRRAELEAVAILAGVELKVISYDPQSPFCIVSLPSPAAAKALITPAFLSKAIYELWATGDTYDALHNSIKADSSGRWPLYKNSSFKFAIDAYQGKRSTSQQRAIINSFRYLGFEGNINMIDPEEEFAVFEEWGECTSDGSKCEELSPKRLFFGRHIANSRRSLIVRYDLKKRPYISTTSMDAELSLVTANLVLAGPGKLIYDPFVGTGSFLVTAAESGAFVCGSDIDGRSFRAKHSKGIEAGIGKNFNHYGLRGRFLDCWMGDLTNSPLRKHNQGFLDGIVCDPPYGVREGLKVLGVRGGKMKEEVFIDGIASYKRDGFIAPKKPYSFSAMLDDILSHAADMLVVGGRLAFWMPAANEDEGQHLEIPNHSRLRLVSCCVQPFNKWSRRLLTYEKLVHNYKNINGSEFPSIEPRPSEANINGKSANELNPFRKLYFQGFKPKET